MLFRYLDFLFRPFRDARAEYYRVKGYKAQVQADVRRAKSLKQQASNQAKQLAAQGKQAQKAGKSGAAQPNKAASGSKAANAGSTGAGAPATSRPQGASVNDETPAIKKKGCWCWKKYLCTQCGSELEKSWDACPYCAQPGSVSAPVGPSAKTRAFMIDAAGAGSAMQLLGWIVPLKGSQRGELYTLAPVSIVGTDPACTVCLNDDFMSSRHAEIKAEAGVWILRDLGSTNGTYVNDRRVDQHELVDNDFVQFGKSLVKFKTL